MQAAQYKSTNYRTVRNLRLGFAAASVLVLLIGMLFVWYSWQTEKEHEALYLSTLVELTGNSMNSYFERQEAALAVLAREISAGTGPDELRRAHGLMRRFHESQPHLSRLVLSLPDGRPLSSDDREPGQAMPTRSDPEAFLDSVRQLEAGANLSVGRAAQSLFDKQWIIPLRYAIRNEAGHVGLVLSATLAISSQQTFWQDVSLPRDAALGLLRDDGYMLSRYPVPKKINYEELYGKPRDGRLMEHLRQNSFPSRGSTEGYNSVAKADYIFAFARLKRYPLTVFVSTPLANVSEKWFRQARLPLGLSAFLLLGGYGIFRWSIRRQLAWEEERERNEAQIAFLAHHDTLTDLPNRLLATDRLHQACAFADRAGARVGLLYLDLDNFKAINDSLGHSTGDALLQGVGKRLGACLRETDTLSRQGGDEFLVILADVRDAESVTRVAEAMVTALGEPFEIDGHELLTTISLGVAIYPDDGRDFETLLKKADMAMYYAKSAGRNTYRYFAEEMNQHAEEGLRMRGWLRQGLERDEFVLHYQPQVDLATGCVVGAEALVRLNRGGSELVPPGRFISVAEDSGLIVPIGTWVLEQACREAAGWRRAGFDETTVAVNISAVQFRRGDLEKTVIRALADADLPPDHLELELTESILLAGTDHVLTAVRRLQSLGVRFSIDDFGTGYSSLSYLKRFNVDRLKIDQSFVRNMVTDADDASIVSALVQMSQSLGLEIIAEGIEDDATRNALRKRGCDFGQGYLFSRPLPAEAFFRYLAEACPPTPDLPA